jgi:ABC-type arginine/histidine transport system permease subunit
MPAKRIFVRSMLTAGLPLILIWAFAETLWRELRSAFRFAWLAVRENIEAYHREMGRDDY